MAMLVKDGKTRNETRRSDYKLNEYCKEKVTLEHRTFLLWILSNSCRDPLALANGLL